jgi:hypothetical protein
MGSLQTTGSFDEEVLKRMVGTPFVFPKVWQSAAYFGGIGFIVLGMLFVMLITNEVQYRTHRQNIIDGWSRLEFLKAKFALMLFLIIVATIMMVLVSVLVGLMYSNASEILSGVEFAGYFALQCLLYMMFGFFIAIFIKRTGLAVIIYISAIVIDNILWAVFTFNSTQIGFFLPLEAADSLVVNPFKPKLLERRTVPDIALVITAFGYISLYAFLIVRYFKKTDLKT